MNLSRPSALSVFTGLVLATSASATTTMSAVEIYDDDSCSGAPLQVVFSPTTSCSLSPDAACSLEAMDVNLFASAGCTEDPSKFSAATFGDSPYVLVELYTPDTNCESLEGVAAYRIDSDCRPTIDAGTSFNVNRNDISSTFKVFADASCSSMPIFQFDLTVDSDECVSGNMKLHVVNAAATESTLTDA